MPKRLSFIGLKLLSLAIVVRIVLGAGYFPVYSYSISLNKLIHWLTHVNSADGYRYHAVDDNGITLDTVKIIPDPQGEGYLAVYHHWNNRSFQVRLATSQDLLNWHYVKTLEDDASQATITAISDGGFIVGYEKDMRDKEGKRHSSSLAFQHYKDESALMANNPDKTIVLKRTLSSCHEGTPNIYSVLLSPDIHHSIVTIGFHYNMDCKVDREAIGILTEFSYWRAQPDSTVNPLFMKLGTIYGNIGDRDAFFLQGRLYSLIEAQQTRNDFGSWRPYLYNWAQHSLTLLTLHTHKGSKSFGNPTFTELTLPNGKQGFVSTEYVFSQGSVPGEAGPLIYFKEYPA